MKRRDFSLAASSALLVAGAGWGSVVQAQAFKPEPDRDYRVLDKAVSVDAPPGKIEVVEFFGYYCHHCNAFEPALEAWAKTLPKDVVLRRVPAAFQDSAVPLQRLYFALESMGLTGRLHAKVFAAIHVQKLNLNTAEVMGDWVAQQGVDKAKFLEQYSSFSVATKCSKAVQLQNAYRIEGVPTLGVAGRFWTDASLARSPERALQVVDGLVAELRAGRLRA